MMRRALVFAAVAVIAAACSSTQPSKAGNPNPGQLTHDNGTPSITSIPTLSTSTTP